MKSLPRRNLKQPPIRNIILHKYEGNSQAIEKHILGALVKCRDILYNPNFKPDKGDSASKEKIANYKASRIISEIMNCPNCPKELQDLNCTVFFITKGGGYQFWGNYKHYVSASFGDDTILILLN